MPSNRRRTGRQPQPETPIPEEVILEGGSSPIEELGQVPQAAGETPATAAEEQGAGETPTPAAEEQAGLPMTVQLHTGAPVEDVVATADVALGDICTIRNVKIKEDDYGLKVVMPRTKMPDTGRFKDACYFHTPELRAQFDAAVKEAYQQTLEPTQEQGGMGEMTM